MRIFYALTFADVYKEQINLYKEIIANHALKGRFTSQNNYHLTLVFVGEVKPDDLPIYESVIDELTIQKTTLDCRHIGAFRKKKRDVVWLGIEKNSVIQDLHESIVNLLSEAGVLTEKRKYHPHITLGRQVLLDLDIQNFVVPPIKLPVRSLALMVSHRVHDQLIYEPIYEVLF